MTEYLLAGAALGLAGSGHCVAMCGPVVALARPSGVARALLYHAGRLATYSGLGALAGGWGAAAVALGLGRPIAIGAGLVVLAYAATEMGLVGRYGTRLPGSQAVTAAVAGVSKWMRHRQFTGPFALGALNGLLPCGLVYAAAVGAAGLGDPGAGVAFMVAFGVGTVPALVAVGLSLTRMPAGALARVRRLAPLALVLVAILLFVRGARGPMSHPDAAATDAPSVHVHR